jgi:8-oxo-dGTP diphosphatase
MDQVQIPRIGVACIVIKGRQVLAGKRLGSHGAGLWAFPGGHLEFKESIEACAKRELFEETGLIAKKTELGPWVETLVENETKHYITHFVWIREFEGDLSVKEPHKCESWEWVSWDNFPTPNFEPIEALREKVKI